MKKDTVGKISTDLKKKSSLNTHNAEDQMRENLTDYDNNMYECIGYHKKLYNSDFYIVVETKKERLLDNVMRNYFIGRQSCPTPFYDQAVYKYTLQDDDVTFLWVVPSKDTCEYMLENLHDIEPIEWELLNYVLQYQKGDLLRLSKKLNNEE